MSDTRVGRIVRGDTVPREWAHLCPCVSPGRRGSGGRVAVTD